MGQFWSASLVMQWENQQIMCVPVNFLLFSFQQFHGVREQKSFNFGLHHW
jgi:hypothetical protein